MDLSTVLNALDHFFTYPLFTVNHTPITLSSLAFFAFIMGGFIIINTLIRRFLSNQLLKRLKMPKATQYTLTRMIQYVLLLVGTVIAFQVIGVDLSGLVVIFGFLSVGI